MHYHFVENKNQIKSYLSLIRKKAFTISIPEIRNCKENHTEINHRREYFKFQHKIEVSLRASDLVFFFTKTPFSFSIALQLHCKLGNEENLLKVRVRDENT